SLQTQMGEVSQPAYKQPQYLPRIRRSGAQSMSDDAHLNELLLKWLEERNQGREVTPTELCADSPELANELKQRIEALQSMEARLHEAATQSPRDMNQTQDHVAPQPAGDVVAIR